MAERGGEKGEEGGSRWGSGGMGKERRGGERERARAKEKMEERGRVGRVAARHFLWELTREPTSRAGLKQTWQVRAVHVSKGINL